MIVVVIKREAADGAASFLGVSCLASETAGTERNAAAEPQTEAPANADNQMQLVTRARLALKRSDANRALVTAGWPV